VTRRGVAWPAGIDAAGPELCKSSLNVLYDRGASSIRHMLSTLSRLVAVENVSERAVSSGT
jgi:hypothetical protein